MAPKQDSLAAVRAAVAQGGSRAIAASALELECSQEVFSTLLDSMATAVVEQPSQAMHWQWALSSYLERLSAEQLQD